MVAVSKVTRASDPAHNHHKRYRQIVDIIKSAKNSALSEVIIWNVY